MNKTYYAWYSRKDVQRQFHAAIPSLKFDGIAKELGIFFIGQDGGTGHIRNVLFYSVTDFFKLSERPEKMSILASVEAWNYKDNGTTFPFSKFAEIVGEKKEAGWRKKNIRTADLLIDIDHFDFSSKEQVEAVKAIYAQLRDDFGFAQMKISGGKGLHLHVPWRYIRKKGIEGYPASFAEYVKRFATDAIKFGQGIETAHIDAGVYSERRLYRLPLSVHEAHDTISYPVHPDELYKLDMNDYTIEKMLEKDGLRCWQW